MSKRILIIKLGAFGDLIIADGAIRDICEYHADCEISILTRPAYRAIYERRPGISHVLTETRASGWQLWRLLRFGWKTEFDSFDIIYDLQKSSRTNLYRRLFVKHAAWSGTSSRSSFPYSLPGRELTVQESYAIQLQAAGVPVQYTHAPDLTWMVEDVSGILKEAGIARPYIVLLPGASARHTHKSWPHYAALAEYLVGSGLPVVTVPGPADMDLCRGIPGVMLTGPGEYLDFFQLAGVLRDAAFVVGNDSGPTHLAAHLGTPGVALFGAGGSQYMKNMQRNAFTCRYSENIRDIMVDDVLSSMRAAGVSGL